METIERIQSLSKSIDIRSNRPTTALVLKRKDRSYVTKNYGENHRMNSKLKQKHRHKL